MALDWIKQRKTASLHVDSQQGYLVVALGSSENIRKLLCPTGVYHLEHVTVDRGAEHTCHDIKTLLVVCSSVAVRLCVRPLAAQVRLLQ